MIVCPECKQATFGEPEICPKCGKLMAQATLDDAIELSTEETLVMKSGELRTVPKAQRVWRPAEIGGDLTIELRVQGQSQSVTLRPDGVLVLGRMDPGSSVAPDVDMGPFGALDDGVSRLHAALTLDKNTLMIKDMGSVNGTYVNGQRVTGDRWRIVRDKDEIRLGKLAVIVHFTA